MCEKSAGGYQLGRHNRIRQPRIGLVVGTRPECLKLASVAKALQAYGRRAAVLINSGQHRAMVERSLTQLGLTADDSAAQCESGSSTAYATALAARDLNLPLAHVEAGLRTNHPLRPFPEEHFRRRIARLAEFHFAPTASAERNLLIEGIAPTRIHRVGQTSIDLLREAVLNPCAPSELPPLPPTRHLIVLTLHRRENYGRGLDTVCAAVRSLLDARDDVGVLCPVHPNPAVGSRIRQHLSAHPRIALTEPLDFRPFVSLLARATLAITDSGGIQEEAPYLGTPILIARENTERPESIALGGANLVAVDAPSIVAAAQRLLDAPRPPKLPFDAQAPYGDGRAGIRIARHLIAFHETADAHEAPGLIPQIA